MVYKAWLHRTETLLVVGTLVLAAFTRVFAQEGGAEALDKPLPITTNSVFMPLVQSGIEVNVKQEDASVVDRAMVEHVELFMIRAFPVEINAVVRGSLRDSCTQISKIQQLYAADQILLKITTYPRLGRHMCADVLMPFAETVSLNLAGFAPGEYRVVVQNVQANFTLTDDNVAPNKVYMSLVSR